MKFRTLIGVFLAFVICVLSGCGGGNVVSNSTDGILSIESVTAPSAVGSQGSVSVKLIAPTGGPGTGTIAIVSSNTTLLAFSAASQSVNTSGKATFFCTTTEVKSDTVVPFTVSVGSLSLTGQMTIYGTGAISLVITAPASSDTAGSITATFAKGAQAAGRKISITSDLTANVAFVTAEQNADATGKSVFTYRVVNITADTTIVFTAKSDSQSVSKSILIKADIITPPSTGSTSTVNSIAFVSALPASISLKGTGGTGRTETSIVSFIVRDDSGQPIAGQTVTFDLDTAVGGITRIPTSAVSDSAGVVKTIINAGVVSTPVRVTASVPNKSISTKSDQLVISTGLPHQEGFSVSTTIHNPEAWNFDGVEVPVTVMLADHFGNPVPDGTAIYFMTDGGSIEANAATKNGMATVKWRSQNPRPADGKAKILAYAIGEESFTDLNGNGLADPGEFTDLPEAFLSKSLTTDLSGKLIRNPLFDPFVDFNVDGIYNNGDGKFNGVLQGSAYLGASRSLYIFKNYQIVMAGSQSVISPDTVNIAQTGSTNIALTIKDSNGNSLPEKTTIALTSTAGGCGTSGFSLTPNSITIDATGSQTTFSTSVLNGCSASGSGNLIVTVVSPKGVETVKVITVTY